MLFVAKVDIKRFAKDNLSFNSWIKTNIQRLSLLLGAKDKMFKKYFQYYNWHSDMLLSTVECLDRDEGANADAWFVFCEHND